MLWIQFSGISMIFLSLKGNPDYKTFCHVQLNFLQIHCQKLIAHTNTAMNGKKIITLCCKSIRSSAFL